MVDVSEVEKKVELARTASMEVTTTGSVITANVADMIKMADIYSRAGVMVPPHCRDKMGVCFALIKQANDWGIPDLSVINKSYVVNNRGVERIAYESQLIHAVIEKNAPLKGRLRAEWSGEGDERRCKIIGTFKGEEKPHEYESQPVAKLREARGRNDSGQLKGSPLWDHDPDVQLFYSASRQWARLYCPDVILGVYTPEDPQYEDPKDITPAVPPVVARLAEARERKARDGDRGFDMDRIQREAGRTTVIEGEVANKEDVDERRDQRAEPDLQQRSGGDEDRAAVDRDAVGGAEAGGSHQEAVGAPVGQQAASAAKAGEGGGKAASKPKPKARR